MSMVALVAHNGFDRSDNWFFVVTGAVFLWGGLRGVITKEGRTRSKGGHVTHYAGKAAVRRGLVGIVIGIAVMAFGAVNLM